MPYGVTISTREIISRLGKNNFYFPKNGKSIYRLCDIAGKRAGIHLAPHMLRRFFASTLIESGVSLLIISKLLGHASVQTTECYLKLDAAFLNGATNALDALAEGVI
jgi:site-specific recombinase XerD